MARKRRVVPPTGSDVANHATNGQETSSAGGTESSNGNARSPTTEINMEAEAVIAEIPPRRRGKTVLQSIWKRAAGNFLLVKSNKHAQPIGVNGLKLSGFIGVIVRTQCPLNYPNFHKVPDATKTHLVKLLKAKFQYTVVLNAWVRKSMSKKFRDYKSELKSSHFFRDKSLEFNLSNIPRDVPASQWHYLVSYWVSDMGKKAEERGKRSRSKQKVTHTSGSKSFARVGEELAGKDGSEVGGIQLYEKTHTRKNGSYLDPEIEDIIEKAKAKKIEKAANPSEDPLQEDMEIMSEILGPQSNGRVKGLGLGPTPSTVFGAFGLSTTTNNSDEEVKRLKETVTQQDNKIAQQNDKIANLERQMAQLINMIGQNQVPPTNQQDGGNSSNSSCRQGATNRGTV